MLALLSLAAALAQSVNVNVMPLRDVLPPQVMYYLSNPGQYFNITVQNPSTEAQQIFFGAELRQVTPASGLEVVVPAKTMPRQPIEVGAGATRVLTAAEMRTMFNHVRSSDVSMPSNLFSDVTSGSFGNLPEGTYEIIINAYQWNPNTTTPVLISNPALSRTMFRVCYQAKAPEWLMPVSTSDFENRDIATLVKQTPILTWTAPQVNCDPKPRNYTYDLKIVQQMPLQDPLEAIERNPVVYQVTGLTVAQCMLPASIVNGLSPFETYVAQVTARSNATQIGALDYINIQNDGRSQLRLFRIKDYSSSSPDGRVTFAPPVVSDPMMAAGGDTLSAQRSVTIDWKAPVSDNPSVLPVTFSYELKAVEAVKDMDLSSEAARRSLMESQPALYEAKNLRTLSHDLPAETFAKAKGSMDVLVQVTARPDTIAGSHRKYIFTDEGRSAPVRFTVGKGGIRIVGLGADGDAPDSLYVFNNPRITSPYFAPDGGARKLFVGDALNLNWERPRYYSGDGVRQDTIRFSYDVELYAAREYKDREEMLKQKPIYTNRNLTQRSDSIGWSVLGEKVAKGDYLFLRVVPKSLNEESIHFLNDSLNTFDAAMAERISHNFFKCRNQIDIENTNPTDRSADDLRGSEVMIGEYKLILDGDLKAVEGKPGHFSGNGHVVWSPLLLTWKLAVEFSDIAINTEDQVYEGVVETWGGKEGVKMRSSEVVDKLFSDWGIDNLIGDTGLPYADRLQEEANGKIRGLADDLPEIAEYYQDFQKGKAFVSNLLKGNLEDVTFPLEIPEEYNTTPVGLTINKMKFAPTFATMDIFGTCVVPESEVTQKQILVFGAPRLCISPSSLIPEGGMVALLKDFVIEEKKTGFECTFKAPTDVIEPADGCFVAWSDNKFVGLTLDVDMKMPEDLKKVDSSGKPTEESPMLHIKTTLSSWDDFLVEANLDEFEHVDLPGFTFGASTVVVDLSATRNGDGMVFPKEDFDRAKAGISTGQDELWEGLFIKKINMRFPESIKIGNGDDPMSFTMENMFIDRSGITLDAGLKNIIDYSTGKEGEIDGFKYTLDHLYISIIQNNFNKFYFDGQLNIPLFKGTVYYTCNIYNQSYTQKGTGKGYAYVFKTTQIEDLDFDFMLGELKLDHRLTYFLIEALPDASGELKTNVELCVGGGVTVAGAKTVNKKLAKLPFDLSLPQLKFCNMRLANGKRFESVYADSLQKRDRAATEVIVDAVAEGSYGWWNEAKDIELCGGKLVLNFGQWGAIAMNSDPSKPSAGEWFEGLPDEVNKAVDDAIEKGKNAVDNAIDAAGKAVDSAIDAAGKAVDAAGKAVDSAIDAAGKAVDAAGKAAESAGKAIDSALDKATGGSGGGNTKKFLDYDENSPGYGPSVAEVPYEAVAPAAAGSNKSLSCKVGPFRFALTDWGFDYVVTDGEPYLAIKIGGDITFSDDLDVTAGTTLEIQSYVKNISKPSEISLEYKDLKFREARLDIETAVLSFQGVLAVDGDAGGIGGTDKGYKGKLSCKVKGGIFELDVQGGYFNHKEEGNNFSWGFFDVMVGGKMGIPMPPVALNNIRGGLYINCVYNTSDKLNPRPRKGAIGLVFGMGITTSDGEAIKGRLDLTVAFDTKKKTLTTFLFNGSVTAVGGIVKSKVKLVYEDNEQERYFQLNLTMDAAFDVFWRKVGEADWRKVNELPYAPPFRFGQDDPSIFYEHSPGVVGLYEYAVRAYDAFGDLTPLSAPHKVFLPDLMPPLGPEITSIVIDRPGKTLYDEVYATIYFHKDSLEDDFVRYVPLYFNDRDSSKQWKLLTNQYIAPGDTMVRIDVTNISTGMITIAAVDTAENMGYAYPKLLRVRDARPPEAPTQVRGLPSLDGTIAILWEMSDTLDVHHYDVFWANSPDDEFTILNRRHVIPRSYTDTVAVDINQRYIYYYVRAVDYATNIGAPSDTIAVLRPSTVPPSRPHLDSAWVDNRMIHTRWIGGSDEMISHYNVYRRRPGAAWTLLRVADGDSVRAHGYALQIDDAPPAPLGARYEYAVETISLWDISSGLSPAFSGRVNYDKVLPLTPTLFADYDVPSGEVKLAWEMDDKNAGGAEYYYCVYRRRKGQETFRFITDVPQGVHTYTGDLLQPGEWAEYYLTVRFRDGRQGQVSNRVTVAAPANPPSTTEQ